MVTHHDVSRSSDVQTFKRSNVQERTGSPQHIERHLLQPIHQHLNVPPRQRLPMERSDREVRPWCVNKRVKRLPYASRFLARLSQDSVEIVVYLYVYVARSCVQTSERLAFQLIL
jgi:hypothetical protein